MDCDGSTAALKIDNCQAIVNKNIVDGVEKFCAFVVVVLRWLP